MVIFAIRFISVVFWLLSTSPCCKHLQINQLIKSINQSTNSCGVTILVTMHQLMAHQIQAKLWFKLTCRAWFTSVTWWSSLANVAWWTALPLRSLYSRRSCRSTVSFWSLWTLSTYITRTSRTTWRALRSSGTSGTSPTSGTLNKSIKTMSKVNIVKQSLKINRKILKSR